MKTKMTKIQSMIGAKAQRFVCGLFAATALLFSGCNQGENEPDAEPILTISPATDAITFSAEASESYAFQLTTNQPVWLASSDQEWCVVTMDAYNNSFTVTALPNASTTPSPAATITVSAGSLNTLTITATQGGVTESDVYVSGYCETDGFDTYACYWKNNVLTKLEVPSGTGSSSATCITVSGNSFHMAGDVDSKGGYWRGGTFAQLAGGSLSSANSIFVGDGGSSVYISGADYYWNGSEKVNTPNVPNATFTANALAVSGGSAYIVGQTYLSGPLFSAHQASYWSGKPSESTKALSISPYSSTNANATCAFASDGSFYAGGYFMADGKQTACYWKDGTCTVLEAPEGMTSSYVDGICVANKIVYVAGSCENDESSIACYWADGRRVELSLPSGASSVRTTGIAVGGGMVCVAGQYTDSSNKRQSCYWINGTRTELVKGATTESAYATGIALIVKK